MHKYTADLQTSSGIFRILWILALIVAAGGAIFATINRDGLAVLIIGVSNAIPFFLVNAVLNYLCRMGDMLDTIARIQVKNNDLLKDLKAESDRRKQLT